MWHRILGKRLLCQSLSFQKGLQIQVEVGGDMLHLEVGAEGEHEICPAEEGEDGR